MSSKGTGAVDNTHRKKWDKEAYERKAAERQKMEAAGIDPDSKRKKVIPVVPAAERKPLRAREQEVEIEENLGKTVVLSGGTSVTQQGGFYCKVCDCVIKDSTNYLDHINGKRHQKAMGYNMRPERATLDQVRRKLASGRAPNRGTTFHDVDERIRMRATNKTTTKIARKLSASSTTQQKQGKDDDIDYAEIDNGFRDSSSSDTDTAESRSVRTKTVEKEKTTKRVISGDVSDEDDDEDGYEVVEFVNKTAAATTTTTTTTTTTAAATTTTVTTTTVADATSSGSTVVKQPQQSDGGEDEDPHQAMLAAMGLPTGFGTSKKP